MNGRVGEKLQVPCLALLASELAHRRELGQKLTRRSEA
jgi:hypothetical protein